MNQNIDQSDLTHLPSTRDGFGRALVDIGQANPLIMGLCADLTESVRMHWFKEMFPKRFIEIGVAEQNLIGVAAGLALAGKVPFAASYAVFSPGRSWDQIRVSVCYSRLNVKIIGCHTGFSAGPDGATHQALEDLAITRVLPNMTVVVPADGHQAYQATKAIAAFDGPCYLRLSKATSAVVTQHHEFQIGKAQILREGVDLSLIATGSMVETAVSVAEQLNKKHQLSCRVLNIHTIKPIDEESILTSALKTKKIFTLEEHQVAGGLGSAVAECISENFPVPVFRLGIRDRFGESGTHQELLKKHGLDVDTIISNILKTI